jgi:hypothetical protein
MVYPDTLFHRRQQGIPMHSYENRSHIRALLSALRAHTKVPYTRDSLWRTPRAPKHPGRARTAAPAAPAHSPRVSGARPVVGKYLIQHLIQIIIRISFK